MSHFRAKGAGFVTHAAAAAWPTPQRILSIVFYPRFPYASGFSRSRSPFATAWHMTHALSAKSSASLCRRFLDRSEVGPASTPESCARNAERYLRAEVGDALNLNVHFHMLVLDGVYGEDDGQTLRFHRLAQPSDAEVAQVAARVTRRIARLLHRRGLGPQANAEEADSLNRDEPLLAALYGASVSGRTATGPRAGMRVATMGDQIDVETPEVLAGPRCASVSGVNVHANVSVAARDRMGLERLCRYAGRPPVAIERLSLLPDGRLLYRLKRRWRNGTTHVIFEPLELIRKARCACAGPEIQLGQILCGVPIYVELIR